MKGIPAQTAAQRILESWGYLVHQVHQVRKRRGKIWVSLVADIWGCIDLACVRGGPAYRTDDEPVDHGCTEDGPIGAFRFVQVCTSAGISPHRRKVERVPWSERLLDRAVFVEIWEARGKGFRVHRYEGVPYTWRVIGTVPQISS